jgi:hypothetical protein
MMSAKLKAIFSSQFQSNAIEGTLQVFLKLKKPHRADAG